MSEALAANGVLDAGPVTEDVQPTQVNGEETAVAEGADSAGDEADPQPDANDGDEGPRRLGGWQRTIKKQEKQIERLLGMVERLTGQKPDAEPEPKPKVASEEDPEPNAETFDGTHAEFVKAQIKWELRQEARERAAKADSEKQQSERQTQADAWAQKCDGAAKKYADFKEVVFENEDVPVSPAMAEVLMESELGAEMAYYLGKHPDEAKRIHGLSPLAQARELGKIEASIASDQPAAEKEAKDVKPSRPVSAAPNPVTRVKTGPVTDEGELRDDLPADEWAKRFRKKLEKRNG